MERAQRFTEEQADWFGIDRGYLKEGKVADLVVVDPEKFENITEDVASEPIKEFGNYERLVNRNDGVVSHVMVNGQIIFEKDEFVAGYGLSKKFGSFIAMVH